MEKFMKIFFKGSVPERKKVFFTSTIFCSAVFSLLADWRNFGGNLSSADAPKSSYLLTRMPGFRGRLRMKEMPTEDLKVKIFKVSTKKSL